MNDKTWAMALAGLLIAGVFCTTLGIICAVTFVLDHMNVCVH